MLSSSSSTASSRGHRSSNDNVPPPRYNGNNSNPMSMRTAGNFTTIISTDSSATSSGMPIIRRTKLYDDSMDANLDAKMNGATRTTGRLNNLGSHANLRESSSNNTLGRLHGQTLTSPLAPNPPPLPPGGGIQEQLYHTIPYQTIYAAKNPSYGGPTPPIITPRSQFLSSTVHANLHRDLYHSNDFGRRSLWSYCARAVNSITFWRAATSILSLMCIIFILIICYGNNFYFDPSLCPSRDHSVINNHPGQSAMNGQSPSSSISPGSSSSNVNPWPITSGATYGHPSDTRHPATGQSESPVQEIPLQQHPQSLPDSNGGEFLSVSFPFFLSLLSLLFLSLSCSPFISLL